MTTDRTDDEQVSELVAEYFVAREAGRDPSLDDLCSPYPLLRKRVAYAVAHHLEAEALFGGGKKEPPRPAAGIAGRIADLSPVGRGGMGEVFRAIDAEAGRPVAYKVMLPHLDCGLLRDYFQTEAHLTAALEHPAIVRVYAVAADACGRPAYSMEFIDGESFHAVIARTPPAARTGLLAHFVAVCEGVQFAHDRLVTHGDIKAANVRVRTDGATFVMDWGLARRHAERVSDEAAATDRERLAALLDHLLTGANPPSALDATRKAAVAGRYPTAAALGQAVKGWLATGGTPDYRDWWAVRTWRWANRHKGWATTLAAAVLLAFLLTLGGSGYALDRAERRRQDESATADVLGRLAPAFREAEIHRDAGRWTDARASSQQAAALAADDRVPADRRAAVFALRDEVEEEHAAAEQDRRLVHALTRAIDFSEREVYAALGYGQPMKDDSAKRIAAAFREYGLDPKVQSVEQMTARLAARPPRVRDEAAASLRVWAANTDRRLTIGDKLRRLSQSVQPHPAWDELIGLAGAARREVGRSAVAGGLTAAAPKESAREALFAYIDRLDPAATPFAVLLDAVNWLDELGESGRAFRLLRHRIAERPDEPFPPLYLMGLMFLNGASQEEMLPALQSARALNPDSGVMLAITLARTGRADEAEWVLADLTRRSPDDRMLKVAGAIVASRAGDPAKGVRLLREALAAGLDPTFVRPLLAVSLMAAGRFEEAEAEANVAAELDPTDPCSQVVRAIGLMRRGKWSDADAILVKVGRDPAGRAMCVALRGLIAARRNNPAEAIRLAEQALAADPDDSATRSFVAMVFALTGRVEDAERLCRESEARGQVSAEMHFADAIVRSGRADWAGCEKAARQCLKVQPGLAAAEAVLAFACAWQGRLDEGREWADRAVRSDPTDPTGWRAMATVLTLGQKWAEAVPPAEQVVKLLPGDLTARTEVAALLNFAGKREEGEKVLAKAAADFASDAEAQYLLGQAYGSFVWVDAKGAVAAARRSCELDPSVAKYHDALIAFLRGGAKGTPGEVRAALLARADALPAVAKYQIELADADYKAGRTADALKRYQASIALLDSAPAAERPAFAYAVWSSVGLCLNKLGRPTEAVYPFERSLEVKRPAGVPARRLADTAWELGDLLESLERFPQARRAYRRALEYDPESADARVGLGFCWYIDGNPVNSVNEFRTAVKLAPKRAYSHTRLGWALDATGEFEEAVKAFEEASALDPQNESSVKLVDLLMDLGRDEQAELAAEAGVKRAPQSAEAHARLATAYLRRNKYAAAVTAQKKAADLADAKKSPSAVSTAQRSDEFARIAELSTDLEAILAGTKELTRKGDALAVARLLAVEKKHADAVKWFEKAFAEESFSVAEYGHMFLWAAIRQAGLGVAAGGTDADALRTTALGWLTVEFTRMRQRVAQGTRTDRANVYRELQMCLFNPALDALRKAADAKGVPADEARKWRQLWADVTTEVKAMREAFMAEKDEG